jgi:hypothetical protein
MQKRLECRNMTVVRGAPILPSNAVKIESGAELA